MFGYVYLTENLINGKKYIGKHRARNTDDDGYLGSGTAIKSAIKKYGADNFSRKIIGVADTREELAVMEIAVIAEYAAVEHPLFYNISESNIRPCTLEQLVNYAAIMKQRWQNMTPEQKIKILESVRQYHLGRPKKAEHWTPEGLKRMAEKRRAQIARGVGVPPMGNRGNKDFRHDEKSKQSISMAVRRARIRISTERDAYKTEQGRIATREKLEVYYTPEVRQEHAKLIRDGQARRLAAYKERGVSPPKFHWYHDPNDPTQRGTFSSDQLIPDGWIAGKGKTGARTVDTTRIIELISAGRKNADIAREVGCSATSVWTIRENLHTK